MFRGLLVCAGLAAFCAPAVIAQNGSVCIFQAKKGHAANVTDSDADAIARELNGHSVQAIAVVGIAKGEEDAEAQKRGCAWIVTLSRQDLPADTPNFAGSLGGAGTAGSEGTVMGTMANSEVGGALLVFNLRKADSHKTLAHAESDDATPYAKMAAQIEKKIGKGN
jgi:hypothetical protein